MLRFSTTLALGDGPLELPFEQLVGLVLGRGDLHHLAELPLQDPVIAGACAAATLSGGMALDREIPDAAEQDAQGDDRRDRDQSGPAQIAAPLDPLLLQERGVEAAVAFERGLADTHCGRVRRRLRVCAQPRDLFPRQLLPGSRGAQMLIQNSTFVRFAVAAGTLGRRVEVMLSPHVGREELLLSGQRKAA